MQVVILEQEKCGSQEKALNDTILKYNTIEAFRELSKSPNAKVIITNGKQPMLIED